MVSWPDSAAEPPFFVVSWPGSGRAEDLMSGSRLIHSVPRAELPQGLKSFRNLLQLILLSVAVTPFRQVE